MNNKRFLIVDDSKTIRKFMAKCLSDLGFSNLDEAAHGGEALEKVGAEMPDVIMLDWNMPIMDGLEFLKKLRRLKGGNAPLVIFCTTESNTAKIALALENKADEYIVKPFDTEILRKKFIKLGII